MADPEVVEHVAASTGLSAGEAQRVVEDVLANYAETTEAFVRRRHGYYQDHGVKNQVAFERIAAELENRLVSPPRLTQRLLRRIIYG